MKKIFLTIIILTTLGCKAQTIYDIATVTPEQINTNSYYIKDVNNHFDAVVGVWKWEEGDSYFEITLQKFAMETYTASSNQYYDHIYGKYKYVHNGVTIAEVDTIAPFPNFKLVFSFETPTLYNVGIRDVSTGKDKKGDFTIISLNTATLELRDYGGVRIGVDPSSAPFSLPTSVVLTKQ